MLLCRTGFNIFRRTVRLDPDIQLNSVVGLIIKAGYSEC
jgi:hypothetical protein